MIKITAIDDNSPTSPAIESLLAVDSVRALIIDLADLDDVKADALPPAEELQSAYTDARQMVQMRFDEAGAELSAMAQSGAKILMAAHARKAQNHKAAARRFTHEIGRYYDKMTGLLSVDR